MNTQFKLCANTKIAVIGLGYVGLPLAIAFAKKYQVLGFDIDATRIAELCEFHDRTGEVERNLIKRSSIFFTDDHEHLSSVQIFIITVPTPIKKDKSPDLTALCRASELVGQYLLPNTIVVYESTVYPGLTREVCYPILRRQSGLVGKGIDDADNCSFHLVYSPERINPGDKTYTIDNIVKIVAGGCSESTQLASELYQSVITAEVYKAESIEVAEAAKIIENTQRDVNIAFMNELARLFDVLAIDMNQVLKAANTKWNFIDFKPGLVGGHCIGVDPYYLVHKAVQSGFNPDLI